MIASPPLLLKDDCIRGILYSRLAMIMIRGRKLRRVMDCSCWFQRIAENLAAISLDGSKTDFAKKKREEHTCHAHCVQSGRRKTAKAHEAK